MDVAVDHDRKLVTAMAVRHFVPSRVEQELLAQVFELLCMPREQRASVESADHDLIGNRRDHHARNPRTVTATRSAAVSCRRVAS